MDLPLLAPAGAAVRLLSLVWPLSHRAARTVQQAFMRKRHNQNWGGCALVVATPRLVGLLALALERADLHLDLGLYLVRRGAVQEIKCRGASRIMTPTPLMCCVAAWSLAA